MKLIPIITPTLKFLTSTKWWVSFWLLNSIVMRYFPCLWRSPLGAALNMSALLFTSFGSVNLLNACSWMQQISATVSYSPTSNVPEKEKASMVERCFNFPKMNLLFHIHSKVFGNILQAGELESIQVPVRSAIGTQDQLQHSSSILMHLGLQISKISKIGWFLPKLWNLKRSARGGIKSRESAILLRDEKSITQRYVHQATLGLNPGSAESFQPIFFLLLRSWTVEIKPI